MSSVKAIILSGGYGTRLYPTTSVTNKQLINVYDKPMIYYAISKLIEIGINEIAVIVQKGTEYNYKKVLEKFNIGKIKIKIFIQFKPDGIPMAFKICKKFINNHNVLLLLGDNFLHGKKIVSDVKNIIKNNVPYIFLKKVDNPQLYGVAEIRKKKITSLIEKPKRYISDLAIIGLYYFDKNCINYTEKLKKSKRGELEILDIIKIYLENNNLHFYKLKNNEVWSDLGDFNSMLNITNFVKKYQSSAKMLLGCVEDNMMNKRFINKSQLKKLTDGYPKNSSYFQYLRIKYGI